jgi:hypothetical protein
MWWIAVIVVVVIGAAIAAILLGGGKGPFVALSRLGSAGKITTTRGRTDFQDDLRKPRNENELL